MKLREFLILEGLRGIAVGSGLGALLGYAYSKKKQREAEMNLTSELMKCGDDTRCRKRVLDKYNRSTLFDAIQGALLGGLLGGALTLKVPKGRNVAGENSPEIYEV